MWDRYSYLFAISMIFAFLDAYGIGANDVANSWATSVSSRSVTFKQAMLGAALFEFLGAVLVGARVAGTVKNGIIDLKVFNNDAGVALLAFTSTIIGSSLWLTFATLNAMPVSTTHTVIGSLIGVGIAVRGNGSGVKWGWNGVSQIIASWFISPAVAGGFAAIIFLIIKFIVMRRRNPVKVGLFLAPVFFFVVAGVLTTAIIVKGSPSLNLKKLPDNITAAAVLGTAAVIGVLSALFWLPWVHAQVVKKDYTIRWYHFFLGPLLWRRQPPADALTIASAIPDYYEGHRDDAELAQRLREQAQRDQEAGAANNATLPQEKQTDSLDESADDGKDLALQEEADATNVAPLAQVEKQTANKTLYQKITSALSNPSAKTLPDGRPVPPKYRTYDGCWLEPWNLYTILRYNAGPWLWYTITGGLRVDVHKMQSHGSTAEQARLRAIHAETEHFDNDAEHLFSFLQVMTACTASFAHGANDVSNAVGPLAVVYEIWSNTRFPAKNTPTPVWILAYGGAAIVIGLATYGWRLMSVLGNRLTLHSPSRGFSMEFGASITVVLASYLGLPVSTTQSITGATAAVALASGNWRSLNYKGLGWIFFSWVLTLPMAGLLSGLIMGIILNAPRFGSGI